MCSAAMSRLTVFFSMLVVLIVSFVCCINSSRAFYVDACDPCSNTTCPEVGRCRYTYHDTCGCCVYCAKREGERCGGTLNHWGSCRPDYECAYRIGSVFNREKFGFCEHITCSSLTCSYGQRCEMIAIKHGRKSPTCICPRFICKRKHNPVCGRDHSTYSSVCDLQQTECTSGGFIGIKHFGACNTTTTNPPAPVKLTTPLQDWRGLVKPINYIKCSFDNKEYIPGQVVNQSNPCLVVICTNTGQVLITPVPGCGGNKTIRKNKALKDYKVDHPSVITWGDWGKWSPCDDPCDKKARSRSCSQIQYEGLTKNDCSNIIQRETRDCGECP